MTLPEPYYDDGQITLYLADLLESCPIGSADVFVTDPPYARAGGIHTGRRSTAGTMSDAQGADQFWLYWFRDVAKRLAAVTRDRGCGFVFCDYRTIHLIDRAFAASGSGWVVSQCIVWDRELIGMGSPFRASHELIAFCRGPEFKWDGPRNMRNVIRYPWPYGEKTHHPAEKPVGLLAKLIEIVTTPGQIVFDPFAGSGSTLLAAKETGRRAIGVEMDEAHVETAANRLAQSVLPLGDIA